MAVNAATGEFVWRVPLGVNDNMPEGKKNVGSPGYGGPIVTAGGLVFIGATRDRRFRAFDSRTGKELWSVPSRLQRHRDSDHLHGQERQTIRRRRRRDERTGQQRVAARVRAAVRTKLWRKVLRARCRISLLAGGRERGRPAGRGAESRDKCFSASTRWGCSRMVRAGGVAHESFELPQIPLLRLDRQRQRRNGHLNGLGLFVNRSRLEHNPRRYRENDRLRLRSVGEPPRG